MHNKNTKNMHKEPTIKTRIMKPTEILAATTGTEDEIKEKPKQLITHKDIEGSPFKIVTRETGSMIVMGKYQISPEMEEEEIAIWMMENEWNIIVTIALIAAEDIVKESEIRRENKNNNSL